LVGPLDCQRQVYLGTTWCSMYPSSYRKILIMGLGLPVAPLKGLQGENVIHLLIICCIVYPSIKQILNNYHTSWPSTQTAISKFETLSNQIIHILHKLQCRRHNLLIHNTSSIMFNIKYKICSHLIYNTCFMSYIIHNT
jgi:hypothetical protein